MAHLEISTFIAVPPASVWAVIADLEHQGEWMADLRRLSFGTEQKSGAGAVLHVTSELFRLPIVKDVMEITAWEPPRRMAVAHRGQFHGTGSFVLSSVDGGTLFTWTEDFRPPLGSLGEFAWRVIVRPHLLRVFARSVANVRRLAEHAASSEERSA